MIDGWHSTDDEVAVPVRSSHEPKAAAPAPVAGPAHDIGHREEPHVTITANHTPPPNPRAMTLSAVLGVMLAIGGVVSYLGLDSITGGLNLTGDLMGGSASEPVMLTITEDGNFRPNSIEIRPGQTVTIENRNADPQVIKSKTGRDLFPVQVIFDEPYSFTIPDDAEGTYVYHSETLPEDRIVTFTVATASAQTVAVSSSSATNIIPLPFGGDPIQSGVTSSRASSVSVAVRPTEHSGGSATISLGGSSSSAESTEGGSAVIPTNPYTVTNGQQQEVLLPAAAIASSAETQETLHGGAPIRELINHTPKRVTETGPAGVLLFFVPALAGVIFVSRKHI